MPFCSLEMNNKYCTQHVCCQNRVDEKKKKKPKSGFSRRSARQLAPRNPACLCESRPANAGLRLTGATISLQTLFLRQNFHFGNFMRMSVFPICLHHITEIMSDCNSNHWNIVPETTRAGDEIFIGACGRYFISAVQVTAR